MARRKAAMKAKQKTRPTGGYFDPALCIDFDEVNRRRKAEVANRREMRANAKAMRASARRAKVNVGPVVDPMIAVQQDIAEHARLRQAWEDAALGSAKRAALTELRAYEIRTGRYVAQDKVVEVAEHASSGWQERK
jgi:hypothetical protein